MNPVSLKRGTGFFIFRECILISFYSSLFPFTNSPRFHAELFLETLGEIRRIIESYHITDFINAVLFSASKIAAFFKRTT